MGSPVSLAATATALALLFAGCSGASDGEKGNAVREPGDGGSSDGGAPTPGTTSYTPPAFLPDHADGVPTTVQWIHGAPLFVKDNVGGDLVGLLRGARSMHAAVSTNDGRSWSWVDPASTVNIDPPLAIAQSTDGDVHIISWSYGNGASYSRVELSRDAGNHVEGFSADVTSVAFPVTPDAPDMSADLVVGADQDDNPTLFYAIYDSTDGGGRIMAGKTSVAAGVAPEVSDHFVALDNSAGATELETLNGPWSDPHNAAVFMAQHPESRDLWFQWGPLNTGDGLTLNELPIRRLRATPSGASTFSPQRARTVATHDGSWGTQNYAVVSTPNSVWFAYGKAASAVNIDRALATGEIVADAVPSPYDGQNSGGCYTMAVSSSDVDIWFAGQYANETGDPDVTPMEVWAKHWNGSTWTTYDTAPSTSDTIFRMSRSSGWDNGLVFVLSRFDYESWRPVVGAIRTLP